MRLLKLFLPIYFLAALPVLFSLEATAFQIPDGSGKTIKIGFLIPDAKSSAAVHGAEMAIRKANEKGGYRGIPFRLVIRSMEGQWGTGSKQAVNLIFDENVCALMSSGDGRNGHLIEQVATKARIVFLSSWASDPTLAQAFVPWYFSCVPTDLQQANAFIEEIYNKRKIDRIALVSDNGYDSKLAVESFEKRIKSTGKREPAQLSYDNLNQNFNPVIEQIRKADCRAVVLFGSPSASVRLIKLLRESSMNLQVFGALSLSDENDLSEQDVKSSYENLVFISSESHSGPKCSEFRKEFQNIYGRSPGAVAEYSFDGMSVLIDAIINAGTDRENIQKALAKTHFEGVTGPIQFDEKGKRIGKINLIEIKDGVPVNIERK
jgi:branched-chain amino acid transport system substrate-binding protein